MRRVEFAIYDDSKQKAEVKTGFFHGWGTEWEIRHSGAGMRSVAICEDDEGRIWLASPERVKFLDSPQKEKKNDNKIGRKKIRGRF